MLKIHLGPIGARCRVELDGADIGHHLTNLTIAVEAGEATRAVLTYSGAVIVEGEPGVLTLQQAEYLIRCDECAKVVQGEDQPARVVDVSHIGAGARERVTVTA